VGAKRVASATLERRGCANLNRRYATARRVTSTRGLKPTATFTSSLRDEDLVHLALPNYLTAHLESPPAVLVLVLVLLLGFRAVFEDEDEEEEDDDSGRTFQTPSYRATISKGMAGKVPTTGRRLLAGALPFLAAVTRFFPGSTLTMRLPLRPGLALAASL
jgi:hypothetical protein